MSTKHDDFTQLAMSDLRARIGQAVDSVATRGERFVIERKGKPLACLVPVSECQPEIPTFRIHEEISELERAAEGGWGVEIDEDKTLSFHFSEQIARSRVTVKIILPHKYPAIAPKVFVDPIDPKSPGLWEDGSLAIFGAMSEWNPHKHSVLATLQLARKWLELYREWRTTGKWSRKQTE